MEFMESGLSDGGPESEADPTTLENASGEVDYNNGYEGNKFNFFVKMVLYFTEMSTDFLCILYLKFTRRIISTTATGVRFCQQRCMRWNI